MKDVIVSKQNALVRQARAVRDGKQRSLIFLEGLRLIEEATRAGMEIEVALLTERLAQQERGGNLLEELRLVCPRVALVAAEALDSISVAKTSPGIVALARKPADDRASFEQAMGDGASLPLIVIMHRTNNPANAGAMLRAAEAAGATGAIATAGATYLFAPKALRGAMGSSFRLPLWLNAPLTEAIEWCRARAIRTVSTSARAERLYTEIDWREARAVIMGPEAEGLTDEELALADEVMRIPMREPVESLNVAVALAVPLYEAYRQRHLSPPAKRTRRQ